MACFTCRAEYIYRRVGPGVVVAEGIVPKGKYHTLVIGEAVDKNTRANVFGMAAGVLRYDAHPVGFTPLLLTEGITSDDIPPYPAGTYSLIADEHSVFYCIAITDGTGRPRGVRTLAIGDAFVIPQGAVAVLLTGQVGLDGEAVGGPEILVAQTRAVTLIATQPSKLIFVEQAL